MTTNELEMIIRGASVFDGLGGPPPYVDIGIAGGRVRTLGDLSTQSASVDIDATGLAVAPGFIDVHTHDDLAVLRHPGMEYKLRGGVTTSVVGNCGFGPAPFEAGSVLLGALTPGDPLPFYDGHAGYARAVDAVTPGVNVAVLAGHGTIRLAVMGSDERAPSGPELASMQELVREALDAGAFGLSSGLIYRPGRAASTDELIELCAVMAGSGARYTTHLRDEGRGLLAALDEAIRIGFEAGVPVQISHLKVSGRDCWGQAEAALTQIEQAQRDGLDIAADQYPYTAGSTSLRAVLDNGAFTEVGSFGAGALRASDIVVASAPDHPEWEGSDIATIADQLGTSERDAAEQVAREAHGATVILHMMAEADVRTILRHPAVMIGSDGLPTLEGRPHPRLSNTFARVVGHYGRDEQVLTVAEAIRRMTAVPAEVFGLVDRGRIVEGAHADLVVFDAERLLDRGTFEHPRRTPEGLSMVIVNGVPALMDGAPTGDRAGQVLRRA